MIVMKKAQLKALAMFAIPHAFVMIFCLIMILSGLASPFISSFAIDNEEKLYVGEGRMLRVFHNGVQVDILDMSNDPYVFTINSNNELIVAYPSVVYRMDLAGNVLEKKEDPIAETYQIINKGRSVVTTDSGDEYRKVSEFGWSRIIKNGVTEVYRLSALSFMVKLLLALCSASLLINGAWLINRYKKLS